MLTQQKSGVKYLYSNWGQTSDETEKYWLPWSYMYSGPSCQDFASLTKYIQPKLKVPIVHFYPDA